MSKITELVIGKVTEEKVNQETGEKEIIVVNPGKRIVGKGSFFFTRKADELFSTKDKNGNEVDGVTNVYSDLTAYNDLGLIKFWLCAAANHPGLQVSEDEIIVEIQRIADEKGTKPLFAGALSVFTEGFYKDKMENQDFMMSLAVKNEKDEKKREELVGHMSMMKEMRNHVANTSTTTA